MSREKEHRLVIAVGAHLLVLFAVFGSVGSGNKILADDQHDAYVEPEITDGDRDHWAFQPLDVSAQPTQRGSSWCRNRVDSFVVAQLQEYGLRPQPPAMPRVLIRRLYLDVTGLPPSSKQISSFADGGSADAWSNVVDSALDDSGYGERWAQHWLDLARFAETDGFEHDKVRAEAWWYRDWVIDALNADMPYDEFISQQLAGDEIHPGDSIAATATRFCLSGPDMPDINLLDERRHTVLNELTSTVGETLLGLQIGCAQCHDHKFDPISQADFYRMRAIFAPSLKLQKNKSLTTLSETYPFSRPNHLMLRGDFRRPGPEVSPGVIRVVADEATLDPAVTKTTAGLRTALAKWMVTEASALTSRVIVNRIWQHHFGTGLVDTPNDFGIMGGLPSNQKLLDWLAGELIESGWRIKHLHRLILNSATYRQISFLPQTASEDARQNWVNSLKMDPEARMLSRYPRWRLEGEAIRDAMLASAGQLNRRRGGPGIRPPLPKELVATLLNKQWVVTPDETEHHRRSIYVFARRNLRYPIFEAFDRPAANASCPQRNTSTTAPQALHLLNSEFTLRTSEHLARELSGTYPSQTEQVAAAYERILGRQPSDAEKKRIAEFLERQKALASSAHEPLTHLCLSLFNSNEFIYVE